MRHLKTFEAYSINEEGGFKKFLTGHESRAERDKKRDMIMKQLDEYDTIVAENPEDYIYSRSNIEAKAKENNYKGQIVERESRASGKLGIIWVDGSSGFGDLASGAGGSIRTRRG